MIVAIAVGLRLTFELLEPIWPFLLGALLMFAFVRVAGWWHDRW